MPLLTGNTSLNLAGFSIFFLLLAGLFFYHMLRRYIRATIVVADKTEKQLYVLRELFGTRQKVLFLAGFINVKGVRVIHHPGSEGSVSSDELVIDFIHRWPFQVCKVSYENLKEIRQQLVDCIFEGDDPRKRGDLK
nr:hypothetical protein [Candidatus Sigynarchaeota archaeon]